jgi:hypothetical protein
MLRIKQAAAKYNLYPMKSKTAAVGIKDHCNHWRTTDETTDGY